jgi:restriction system protein
MTRLWIVRAGKLGERELAAIEQKRLLPGFMEAGDLGAFKDREAIQAHLQTVMPEAEFNRLRNFAAQLNQFVHVIQMGDLVVMPRKLTDGVAIGEVTGDYHFDAADPYRHSRAVKWLKESIPRDTFRQDLRHSFGAFMTICEIQRNAALARVQAVLNTGGDPGELLGKQGLVPAVALTAVEDGGDAADYPTDIEEIANQQITAMIKSEFSGHALADLVAEILRVEGYIIKLSPPGPDGGVDMLAAGGSPGLSEDRICVQVKSGYTPANHDVVLRLIGSMTNTQARTGLLVSISGVNAVAQKELDNNFFRLRLWQMTDLLSALFRTYSRLSEKTRAKLPLKQIWTPVAGAEE